MLIENLVKTAGARMIDAKDFFSPIRKIVMNKTVITTAACKFLSLALFEKLFL